ncbi:cell division protein ZapE [uncultured Nevskia sp.]|uniref:cell division protein ZapE n=1 Tax=uncultured Nevskia sp. TaxID=228950 RepID=UPI0025CDB751|nr:cell division protein ZapE [uncultured Nevskia sp.]
MALFGSGRSNNDDLIPATELAPPPAQRYAADLQREGFVSDAAQAAAVAALQKVYETLIESPPRRRFGSSRLSWNAVPGLYLWGGVGRGKTYLMDAFFDALPFSRKRRTHFHRFMLDVHAQRNRYQGDTDPLQKVADEIAEQTRVLCFDEFFVADIADAMILGRLFEALFKRNITLIATSNVPPDGLYKDGLQRQNFLPAIEVLKSSVTVLNVDGGTDYRLRQLQDAELYLYPCDARAEAALARHFEALAPHGDIGPGELILNDRVLHARRIAEGAVWFDFDELCEGPRSAADYIELGRLHHTVVLTGVPRLDSTRDDATRRFMTLVDEFYDRGVKLLIGAEVPANELYVGTKLKFEFGRIESRLREMQSEEYLASEHRG